MRPAKSQSFFTRFTKATSRATGQPLVFGLALGLVLVWAASGPLLGFSNTWQLVINTSTSVMTFLMVFLIQSTQNRDSEAIQVKLDELIRVSKEARTELLDLEELDEPELNAIRESYEELAEEARRKKGLAPKDAARFPKP
jgi:low affinity Fe/Cu permease